LNHVRTKQTSEPLEKFTDWEWFQSLASNLISLRTEINYRSKTSGNIVHCEVPRKQGWAKGTNVIHGLLGLKFNLVEKANAISYCLENQFTLHDLYEKKKQRVDARAEALLEAGERESVCVCVFLHSLFGLLLIKCNVQRVSIEI
jgi:hypothetical protein